MSEAAPPDSQTGTPRPKSRRRVLGEMLLDQGVITQQQLAAVVARQKAEEGGRLGRLLVDLGYATEAEICEVVAEQLNIPAADLVAVDIPNEVLNHVTKELATKYLCLPWFIEGRELYLIMADPTNVTAADAVAFHTGLKIRPVVAPETEVAEAIVKFYAAEESSLAQFDSLDLADQLSVVSDQEIEVGEDNLEQAAQTVPLVKLVNAVIADATRAGASDIHIEPQEKGLNLRY